MARTTETLTPPTRPMATLPPDGSEFWRLTIARQTIYLRATDEGKLRAEAWMNVAPRREWEPIATIVGAGMAPLLATYGFDLALALIGVADPYDGSAPAQDAIDALGWYDRAFRGRVDEALDEEPTR